MIRIWGEVNLVNIQIKNKKGGGDGEGISLSMSAESITHASEYDTHTPIKKRIWYTHQRLIMVLN